MSAKDDAVNAGAHRLEERGFSSSPYSVAREVIDAALAAGHLIPAPLPTDAQAAYDAVRDVLVDVVGDDASHDVTRRVLDAAAARLYREPGS